jgi:hypothetical protein
MTSLTCPFRKFLPNFFFFLQVKKKKDPDWYQASLAIAQGPVYPHFKLQASSPIGLIVESNDSEDVAAFHLDHRKCMTVYYLYYH